jgi:hypothetical protein
MSDRAQDSRERADRMVKLRRCAEGVPVLGAREALTHAEWSFGIPAPAALDAVAEALDAWDGVRVHPRDCTPGVQTPYTAVVSALTRYHYANRRALGLRS